MNTPSMASLHPAPGALPLAGAPGTDRFRFHLALLLLLAILPALGMAIYTGFEQRRTGIAHAREQAVLLARLAAVKEERLLDNTRQVLAALAALPAINNTNRTFWNGNFRNMLRLQPQYLNFGLLEADGTLFASALPFEGAPDFSRAGFYQTVIREQKFSIGEHETGPLTNRPTLTFGHPVRSGSTGVTRIVFATVDIGVIGAVAAETKLPDDALLITFDRKGRVIGHHPNAGPWLGQEAETSVLFQAVTANSQGATELPGLDGVRRLYAFAASENEGEAGLFTAVGIAPETAYAAANQTLWRNLLLIALTGLLALAAARLYARHYLLQPIHKLTGAARRLAAGDLSARTGLRGKADLNQLARTFDEMADALQRRQTELEQAGQRIQAMNEDLERRITEREHAEEQVRTSLREKEVMLKEIHHRVKNNLQVVSSLLRLQAHNLKHPDALAAFDESCVRVQSMALVHEKLYQSSSLAELDFGAYAEDLVDSLLDSFGVDSSVVFVRLDMDKVSLDINQAIPCALIFNELVSNALKYAFPDHRNGELRIKLRCGADHQVCLTICDDGIGLPEHLTLEHAESLGLQLVNTLVRQLRGRLEVSRVGGTQYQLTFTAVPAKPEEKCP